MSGHPGAPSPSWEQVGQELAPLLDNVFATVIAGVDAHAAAAVAIGLARTQGQRRRVAIADLVGECPPLEALNYSDDPHGISDSFLYGVSLNRIARQVNEAGSVFLMPSGTESVAHEAVYGNERWRRLAAGFQEVGALLLVVAVPGTPGFAELCGFVGSLLPVGDVRFPMPPGIPIIAPPAVPPTASPTPAPGPGKAARAREAAGETTSGRNRKVAAALVALLGVAIAIGYSLPRLKEHLPAPLAAWLAAPVSDTSNMLVKPTPMDTGRRVDSIFTDSAALTMDSVTGLAANGSVMMARGTLTVVNPADSADVAQYAIFYSSANTRREALPSEVLSAQQVMAVSPVMLDGAQWIRVFIGAAATRQEADSLLARLRLAKVVTGGSVATVPYAFRLEGGVPAASVPARMATYTRRGILVYALVQPTGSSILYTGAFESPAQATTLADSLRALGMTPVLAYRTGRAF